MQEMVEKWVTQVVSPAGRDDKQSPIPENERIVVLTGATGSLGAHILHNLVSSNKVRTSLIIWFILISKAGSQGHHSLTSQRRRR